MDKILARFIPLILSVISPEIKQLVADFVIQLEANAKKTPNPWDDMLVELLKVIIKTD